MRKNHVVSPYTAAGVMAFVSVLVALLVYIIAWGNGSSVRLSIADAAVALIVTPVVLGMIVFAWSEL